MDPITQQQALAAAGAGDDPVYVEDLFSTHQWDGSGFSRQIPTGIDMTTDGGMVWTKVRDYSDHHYIADTTRKTGSYYDELSSSQSYGSMTGRTWGIDTFLSTGIQGGGNNGQFNSSLYKYVSWSFRKAPHFFDIVSWTGNGTANRKISHNLGSTPGAIWVKRTDGTGNWCCWHRSLNGNGNGYNILNTTAGMQTNGHVVWGDETNYIAPTATEFTVSSDSYVNYNGYEYIAYIFGHNQLEFGENSDEDIIKCGTYTGNGFDNGPSVNLGWEPQWLLVKRLDSGGNWVMIDSQRGFNHDTSDAIIYAHDSNNEVTVLDWIRPRGNGFTLENATHHVNNGASPYMYIAIRRPQKKPEVGTEVFMPILKNGQQTMNVGFKADMAIAANRTSSTSIAHILETRANRGYMSTTNTNADGGTELYRWYQGTDLTLWGTTGTFLNLVFKRARGFMDVLLHRGAGAATNVYHGLGVAPEMVWVKRRSSSEDWAVYHVGTGNTKYLSLNYTTGAQTHSAYWNNYGPTSTYIQLGTANSVNAAGHRYLIIAFASLPGVSKIGTYTGTGSDGNNIDCGFTNGARFVMVKRATSTGGWIFWDTARGINIGYDDYLRFDSSSTDVSNTDWIDAYNPGFTINGSDTSVNGNGGTYLFWAIA